MGLAKRRLSFDALVCLVASVRSLPGSGEAEAGFVPAQNHLVRPPQQPARRNPRSSARRRRERSNTVNSLAEALERSAVLPDISTEDRRHR